MKKNGFTLIELLVVVAIIGLLASVIIASVSSARTKAAYAAAKQLDANFSHNLGDSLVGQWLMDDGLPNCTGSVAVAKDSSGFGHDGTPNGGTVVWSTDTPFGQGCSLQLNGSGTITTTYIVPLYDATQSFTWSMWINLSSADPNFNSPIIGYRNNGTGWVKLTETSFEYNGSLMPYSIPRDQWLFLTIVKSGTTFRYLKNGVQVSTGTSNATAGNAPFYIGGQPGADTYMRGLVDNVRIYDRALDTSEIQKLYALDAPKHGMAFVGSAPWSLGGMGDVNPLTTLQRK